MMTYRLWVLLVALAMSASSAATWFVSGKVRAAAKAPPQIPAVAAAASASLAPVVATSLSPPAVPVHAGFTCGPTPAIAKAHRPRTQHAATVVATKTAIVAAPAVIAAGPAAVVVPAPIAAAPVYGVVPHASVVVTYHSAYYGYHGGYPGGYYPGYAGYWHSGHWR
ncbi:hypothetical protein [Paraburkholderia sp. BCC1885]|uniref:hypothetical protein n=1 Tax=Paraburkholderia sp. BCC1885 TaxID=2562669 RepID=UPI001182B653|nr:hypothetical protein [Paraburkholderia sp. BCC1885]